MTDPELGTDLDSKSAILADTIQSGLVRTTRHAANRRDWALYVFFHIESEAKVRKAASALGAWLGSSSGARRPRQRRGAKAVLASASRPASGLVDMVSQVLSLDRASLEKDLDALVDHMVGLQADEQARTEKADQSGPESFQAWLNAIARKDVSGLLSKLDETLKTINPADESPIAPDADIWPIVDPEAPGAKGVAAGFANPFGVGGGLEGFDNLRRISAAARDDAAGIGADIDPLLGSLSKLLTNKAEVLALAEWFNREGAGAQAIKAGLVPVLLHELLGQLLPALLGQFDDIVSPPAPLQSERETDAVRASDKVLRAMNICFTSNGLAALRINEETLASFPEAFRDGMAARAGRLADTGGNAPENWHGELGQSSVHGFFTGGFPAFGAPESAWEALREAVHAFNINNAEGRRLRDSLEWTRFLGFEIVHVELGEKAYPKPEGDICPRNCGLAAPDREHFGFRDGLSQPFVNLGLGQTGPGGGTARRDRTWDPVAPGEIFLGRPDEDGRTAEQPINPVLRNDGTYLVFRKLEQDVVGFRDYVSRVKGPDEKAQAKLMAQFVGRWQNGSDLVRSPDTETPLNEQSPNDFRYAADDPEGRNCPLGAHVRRANPRDIGGRGDARLHRLLRRSLPYGGSLIGPDDRGRHRPRGLLFIAANARIEMQFEVVQGRWLNSGEFLGQAGLGKCPLTGTHARAEADTFLEPAAVAPIRNLPSFVHLKGGDYFFVPSLEALKRLAIGDTFPPATTTTANLPLSATSRYRAPALFDPDRLKAYAGMILSGQVSSVTVKLPAISSPPNANEQDMEGNRVMFVARGDDVRHVLGAPSLNGPLVKPGSTPFSVRHYFTWGKSLGPGLSHISGTDAYFEPIRRKELHDILNDAYATLSHHRNIQPDMEALCETSHKATLQRTSQSGEIDLVRDLAAEACYSIMRSIYGIGGPNHLTELAAAMPFARQHLGQVDPDWLGALRRTRPEDPGLATLQLWASLHMVGLVGNNIYSPELSVISRQAAGELRNHIRKLVDQAFLRPASPPLTLIDAFVADALAQNLNEPNLALRKSDVTAILAELTGFFMGGIPSVFGEVMEALLDRRLDFSRIVRKLKGTPPPHLQPGDQASHYRDNGLHHLLLETLRLHPSPPVILRYCEKSHTLPSTGTKFKKGDWICCLMGAANLDIPGASDPFQLSLYPWLPGDKRPKEIFTTFGPHSGLRPCWGTGQALQVMSTCLDAAANCHGLRRIAGPKGAPADILRIMISLRARFDPFVHEA